MMMKLPVANLKLPVAGCQLPDHGGGTDIPVCVSDSKRKMPIQFTGNRQLTTSNFQGFTLVELIISIGLVLIIMLGVNFVFKMTSDTITAGQTLSETVRNNRAAQSVLQDDFAKLAANGPSLIIASQTQAAFRFQQQEAADRDYNKADTLANRSTQIRTVDFDENGVEGEPGKPGEQVSAATYNDRNHRLDTLSFFAQGKFSRQTGGAVTSTNTSATSTYPLISEIQASEAWIWYGHLGIYNGQDPNDADSYPTPGDISTVVSPNPNNFYATQWVLGRVATLLRDYDDPSDAAGTGSISLNSTSPYEYFIDRSWNNGAAITSNANKALSPLAYNSQCNGSNTLVKNWGCRYDLGATSIAAYGSRLTDFVKKYALGTITGEEWWEGLFTKSGERFRTNPNIVRPISAPTIARQSPIFMQGCTQFIVEFAGDFVAQENDPTDPDFGQVIGTFNNAATPLVDGEIDFVVVGTPANGPNARKQIRWYGMPRDTNGDGAIPGQSAPTATVNANGMPDTVPLRDVLATFGQPAAGFEKFETTPASAFLAIANDYANPVSGLKFNQTYTCAWGPADNVRPRMIRLTIVIDDPNGRLPDGQTYEYVFSLPPAE